MTCLRNVFLSSLNRYVHSPVSYTHLLSILLAMLHVPRCYLLGKLDRMYYGNNKTTARNIGFDDSFIYDEIALKLANRKLPPEILLHNEEIKVFEAWTQKEGKTGY